MQEPNHYSDQSRGIPHEIKRWNWGAFAFNVWWGIGNKTYLPLLCLVPILNIIWPFVCGFKGNEWAWKDGRYNDITSFKKVQETWNLAGLIYFIVSIVMATIFFSFIYSQILALVRLTS